MQDYKVVDQSGILFKGSGTGLTATLVAVAKVVPLQNFEFTTTPSWIYFLGVIFAFVVHGATMAINGDIEMRQYRDSILESIRQIQDSPHLTEQLQSRIEELNNQIAKGEKDRLTPKVIKRIMTVSNFCYLFSVVCFVTATYLVISILSEV